MSLPLETSVPNASVRPSPVIQALGEFFTSRGLEAYMVGGVVRDTLLGRATKDIDVVVAADAQSTGLGLASFLGGRSVPLDEAREIVRIVVPGDEGVTFVDLNSIHDGIEQDLKRRDFTLDALAVRLGDTTIQLSGKDLIDPHGGLSDLRAGIIRAILPSVFEEDPARLMRAPRLSVQLGFEISEDTAGQIRSDAYLVTKVAPERIRGELLQLLAVPGATSSLRCLDDLGLLCELIPELAEARGVAQPKEHHWDVFNHMLETAGQVETVVQGGPRHNGFVANTVPSFKSMNEHFAEEVSDGHTRLTLIKLAGLLHDIAKPATKSVDSTGRVRFLGHHTEGAETADRILKRLRFSRRGVELVRLMVENHLRPAQMAQPGELPTGRAIYRYFRDLGEAAIDTLYLNMADYLAARGPALRHQEWSEYCRVIGHILREGTERKVPESLPKLVDGHDIMGAFSLVPGPNVGLLLGLVQEAYASGEISTRDEALDLVKANLDLRDSGAKIR